MLERVSASVRLASGQKPLQLEQERFAAVDDDGMMIGAVLWADAECGQLVTVAFLECRQWPVVEDDRELATLASVLLECCRSGSDAGHVQIRCIALGGAAGLIWLVDTNNTHSLNS